MYILNENWEFLVRVLISISVLHFIDLILMIFTQDAYKN